MGKKRNSLTLPLLIIGISVFVSSCGGKVKTESINDADKIEVDSVPANAESISDLKAEEMIFLVEGAVDTWFFYNLDNYASYEAVMRKTDYDPARNIHIHHVRYRTMNKEGGYETTEKTFEVSFTLNDKGVPDFKVEEVPTTKREFSLE